MRHFFCRCVLLSVVVACLSCASAFGQSPEADAARLIRCNQATRSVESGSPGRGANSAWRNLASCAIGVRVGVYLNAMRRARTSSDLEFVSQALMAIAGLQDERLFAEGLAIAGDREATREARVVAFMALAILRNSRASPRYEQFIGGLSPQGVPLGGCSAMSTHGAAAEQGPQPLQGDYKARILVVRNRVRRDTTEPADVRSAAACS